MASRSCNSTVQHQSCFRDGLLPPVDLRSDTVTRPTPAQRQAMAAADVGDDVFGEDPTVHRLETRVAALLGKKAAVFVPSGTMANLTALLAHCPRGHSVLLGDKSHIYNYEGGGASALGIPFQVLPNMADGTLGESINAIRNAVWPDDPHHAVTACVALENTHNLCGGYPLPSGYVDDVGGLCAELDIRLHIDGARILNAAVRGASGPIAPYSNGSYGCVHAASCS